MSRVYTNQKTGLTVVSGKVKDISEDKKTITVAVQEFVRGENGEHGSYQNKDAVLVAQTPVEDIIVGDFVTGNGFKAGGGKINVDRVAHENNYVEAEGFGIISGEVLFANKNEEIDRETNQPRLTQAGTPRKPHFDITVAAGTGESRVNHVVRIYNTQDQDNIGRYEKLFANFDRKENPVYVSIVTKAENANTYMRESTDKQGRVWQNSYMSHMGTNFMDVNFVNGRERNTPQAQPPQQGAPAAPQQAPAQEAPQNNVSQSNGFDYNLDDLDELDMAQ